MSFLVIHLFNTLISIGNVNIIFENEMNESSVALFHCFFYILAYNFVKKVNIFVLSGNLKVGN